VREGERAAGAAHRGKGGSRVVGERVRVRGGLYIILASNSDHSIVRSTTPEARAILGWGGGRGPVGAGGPGGCLPCAHVKAHDKVYFF
jgi:hypothetical protein